MSAHNGRAPIRPSTGEFPSIRDLKREWTKGSMPPVNYADWADWAEAQTAHGLEQTQCDWCKRWYFPQEKANHSFCTAAASAQRNQR